MDSSSASSGPSATFRTPRPTLPRGRHARRHGTARHDHCRDAAGRGGLSARFAIAQLDPLRPSTSRGLESAGGRLERRGGARFANRACAQSGVAGDPRCWRARLGGRILRMARSWLAAVTERMGSGARLERASSEPGGGIGHPYCSLARSRHISPARSVANMIFGY